MEANPELILQPIGRVVAGRPWPDEGDTWEKVDAILEIDPQWLDALEGIDGFSHIWIIWWLDRTRGGRGCEKGRPGALRVHPEGRNELPLVGLFGTRAPFRPNPIAMTAVRLLAHEGNRLRVQGLDAYQDTPILDLKPYLRRGDLIPEATMPAWLEELWQIHDQERATQESLAAGGAELASIEPIL